MPKAICSSLIVLALFLSACTPKAAVPGSLNNFDATAYADLTQAQAAIDAAKTQVTATTSQTVKTSLNVLIAAYNVAEASYQTYHTTLAAGGNPDTTVLASQITAVVNALAQFTTQIKAVTK